MSNFKKSFKSFAESKDKGLGDKDGLIPNQDIPKANKGPHLLDLKGSLAGKDYKGQMTTNPVKGTKDNPLPYHGGDVKDKNKLLVHDEDDVKSGFAFKGNKVQTPENSASLGEKPDIRVEKVKSKKMTSESVKSQVSCPKCSSTNTNQQASPDYVRHCKNCGYQWNTTIKNDKQKKMTSEQFIEETKNLSPEEFINFFVEGSDEPLPTITDLYGNQFTPDPNQTIQYLSALMMKNPRLLSRFVREIKRHENGMGSLVNEHFNDPEFYSVLTEGMSAPEEGRKRCHRISRAMNEQYMDALGKYVVEQKMNEEIQPKADLAFEDGGPIGNGPQNPSGKPIPKLAQPQGGAMGGGSGPQMNAPAPGGPMGGGSGPQINAPAPGGAFGGGGIGNSDVGMPNAAPDSIPAGMNGTPPPMPPGQVGNPGLNMGNGEMPNSPPMPKLKGESAHGNMIEEMGSFPHMKSFMINHCSGKDCNK